ncbi:hypothetical protein ACFQ07_23865, partial [Actinomadura adrarensis]
RSHDPARFEQRVRYHLAADLYRRDMLDLRNPLLTAADPSAVVEDRIRELVERAFEPLPRQFDQYYLEVTLDDVRACCPISVTAEDLAQTRNRDAIFQAVLDDALRAYRRRQSEFGDILQDVARRVLVNVIDRCWRDHLARSEALPASLGLMDDPTGDRTGDPTAAYEEALASSYLLMTDEIIRESVGFMFHLDPADLERDSD